MIRKKNQFPLVVDFDNSIIKTDCLIEALVFNLKVRFYKTVLFFITKIFNKFNLKKYLFENFIPDFDTIPTNNKLISFLKEEKKLENCYLLIIFTEFLNISYLMVTWNR